VKSRLLRPALSAGAPAAGLDAAALAPVLLALAVLFRRLLAGWALAGGDLQLYFFPYWAAAARAFQAGQLPLWNPYLFAGAPLLANSQAGVFYPPNWLLWALAGPTLEGATATLHASVLLHLGVAALTAYALARRLGLARTGAALAALLYSGGGFLGVHVEHLNQLQALAWLPLALLPPRARPRPLLEPRHDAARAPHFWDALQATSPLNIAAFALILLAGHTQTAFIAAVGVVAFRAAQIREHVATYPREHVATYERKNVATYPRKHVLTFLRLHVPTLSRSHVLTFSRFLLSLAPFAIAALLAAVQLAPTLELAQQSLRAGGLPWREAVSFSLVPWQAHRVFLPPYLLAPALPEGVAYLGLLGLALAGVGAVRAVRSWRSERALRACLVLAGVGLFLALGAYNPLYLLAARLGLPGVIQFRAPARYLALYALGAALLAGYGVEWGRRWLESRRRRSPAASSASNAPSAPSARVGRRWLRAAFAVALLALVALELGLSAEALPHARATSPRTYTDLRPATAYLLTAAREAEARATPPGRFLSISKMLFEPGDKAEIESIYGGVLDADALWAYLVAAKAREVLAPNLPLAFGVPAADGYDGGLLPLRRYAEFATLLLPEGTLDGRLRENLEAIPDARWLALLDVRFLITDKVGDLWAEGVYYDRQFQPELVSGAELVLGWLPGNFAADGLSLLCESTSTAEVEVAFADGRVLRLPLAGCAGETPVRVTWGFAAAPERLTLRAGAGPLRLTGATLVNTATGAPGAPSASSAPGASSAPSAPGAFYPLTLSERFRLVHSGDVKLYATVAPTARVVLLHDVTCLGDSAAVLAALGAPGFDPETTALLEACPAALPELLTPQTVEAPPDTSEAVEVLRYSAERVELRVRASAPGVLLLKDAWYPGWRVTVAPLDGANASPVFEGEPLVAQALFRAAPLPAGEWRVTFSYQPDSLRLGSALSVLGLLAWFGYAIWRWRKQTRQHHILEEEALNLSS